MMSGPDLTWGQFLGLTVAHFIRRRAIATSRCSVRCPDRYNRAAYVSRLSSIPGVHAGGSRWDHGSFG